MMLRCLVFVLLLLPGMAMAVEYRNCDKAQIAYAGAAVLGAQEAARAAGAAVGDNPDYIRWFGAFTSANAEEVRAGMKAVDRALDRNDLTLVCPEPGEDGCAFDVFANVWPDRPFEVNLCTAFFTQPTLAGVVATSRAFETGMREGTIIHEVSHFIIVAGTEDHCYGRTDCEDMAKQSPLLAIENADTFQYFAEDIVLGRAGRLP